MCISSGIGSIYVAFSTIMAEMFGDRLIKRLINVIDVTRLNQRQDAL